MPDLYDYLLRFRRLLVPPGAPGQRARMPSAPSGLEDELEAVFEEIDRIDEERVQLETDAQQESERIRHEVDEMCEQRMDEARRRADEGYAQAYRDRADELGAQFDDLIAEGRSEAERIERGGSPRASELGREIARAIIARGAARPVAETPAAGEERPA